MSAKDTCDTCGKTANAGKHSNVLTGPSGWINCEVSQQFPQGLKETGHWHKFQGRSAKGIKGE